MGQLLSAEAKDGKEDPNFRPFVLSEKAKANVFDIKKVLDSFAGNNMKTLFDYLSLKTNIPEELRNKILEHHSDLIKNHQIDEDDTKLLASIGLTTDKQITERFPNHAIFESIPGLTNIKGNIINILKNYRFYEYKYIYLNLFLMQFSETIINAFMQTTEDLKASASAYIMTQNDRYGQFMQQISDMVVLSEEDRKNINNLTKITKNELEKTTTNFYQQIEKNQMKTLQDVLKSLQQEVQSKDTGKTKGGKSKFHRIRRNTNLTRHSYSHL